ncbi:MAG: class I SAM-dependent methyltransferase [Candidatus Bipolaricaulota bacterium]
MTGPSLSKDYEGNHERVKEVFGEIAGDNDRVNRVISLGQIDRWRHRLVSIMDIPEVGFHEIFGGIAAIHQGTKKEH